MNFRLTVIMLTLLALLVGAYAWYQKQPAAPVKTEQKNLLIDPAPRSLSAITYTRDGAVQVAFINDSSGTENKWKMTSPVDAPAESWRVDQIADALKGLEYKEKFEPEASGDKSAQETGVAGAKDVIQFKDDAGRAYTLTVGKRTVGGAYATLNGAATIYVLESNPVEQLAKDTDEFRSKTMAEVPTEQVSALAFLKGKTQVDLVKNDGKWLITEPVPTRASQSVVEDVLNALKSIQATGFTEISKDMLAAGLNPPLVSVTAYVDEPAPTATATQPSSQPARPKKAVTLQLGYYTDLTDKKNIYASMGDSKNVFLLSADILHRLNKQLNDLRDPAITPAPVANATRVEILEQPSKAGNEPARILLSQKGGQWELESGGVKLAADGDAVKHFLEALRDLRANKYVDGPGNLKAIGLEPPVKTIRVTVPGQPQQEVILIGKPETAEPLTPVQRQGENTVYLVQSPDVAKLNVNPLDLRSLKVADYKPDQIDDITIEGPGVKEPATLRRDGKQWKLTVDGKTEAADAGKVSSLLGDLDPLTALKWADTEAFPKTDAPDAIVRLTVTEAPSEVASATGPATQGAMPAAMGPMLPKTYAIRLVHRPDKTWLASTTSAGAVGTFAPSQTFIQHVTATDYRRTLATQPAPEAATTEAATTAASQPAAP